MKEKAVFPGSFDPITRGHEELINRASKLFDVLYVAVGINTTKRYCFDLDQRLAFLRTVYHDHPSVEIITFEGLTVDLCRKFDAKYIIRGLRSPGDYEYEARIAAFNRQLNPELETVFLSAGSGYAHYSSTVVREIHLSGGDIRSFVPKGIGHMLLK